MAPNVEVRLYFLAKYPSQKSVIATIKKIIKATAKASAHSIKRKIRGPARILVNDKKNDKIFHFKVCLEYSY